jgi:hypothetical protein
MGVYEAPEPVTLKLASPSAPLHDLRPLGRVDSAPAVNVNSH